jgi:hypothetical protein
MASIQLFNYFSVVIDDVPHVGGSLSEARGVEISDNEFADQTFKIDPETAVKVFDKTENESLGDFDFLWMESDFDVLVQFTTDAGTTDVYDVKELKGSGTSGKMGPPKIFGSDATQLSDGSIDTFDGTAGTVDEIWVYNADDTETARVRVVVAT